MSVTFAQVKYDGIITEEVARTALDLMDVDKMGLDHIDRNILVTIIEKFDGGPVGLDTLAAAIGEDAGTIEDVYEPYLIKNGFLNRTPKRPCSHRSYLSSSGTELIRAAYEILLATLYILIYNKSCIIFLRKWHILCFQKSVKRGVEMSPKTDTEVIIGGKVFTLSGYESEDYMQKIASYINGKITEYGKLDGFRRQPLDKQNILLQLNIADDYFKAKKQISILEEELQGKEKELYDLKHELISAQIKLENAEKQGEGTVKSS